MENRPILFFEFGGVGWGVGDGTRSSLAPANYLDATFTGSSRALANVLDATLSRSSLELATRPKASLVGAHRWNWLHVHSRAFILEREARSTQIWCPTCGSDSGAQGTAEAACWEWLPGNWKSNWTCEGKHAIFQKHDDFELVFQPFKKQFLADRRKELWPSRVKIPSPNPPARMFLVCYCWR